ncbi:MAG: hypothetical protein FWE78_00135 [Methanimicrococcus sp.]|nr:hypothetical protein [Methanimicrococcus sp.]
MIFVAVMLQKIVLSLKLSFKKYALDQSAVSVIFGALLLLSIFTVLFSVFLVTALPAWTMHKEAEESDLLYADVLKFSENTDTFSRSGASGSFHPQTQILSSRHSTVMADETGGFLLFQAEMNLPPEVVSLLKTESVPGQNFKLSSGSVLFINSYTQIPDQFYFYGPAGLILCQEDGASFIRPPPIYLSRGDGGKILLQLSGCIIECRSSSVSVSNPAVCFRNVRTVYVHDFVSEVEIRYVPPAVFSVDPDLVFYENRDIAVENYLSGLAVSISDNFPEIEAVYRDEIAVLTLTSETPIEIDIQITVLQIEFE